MEQNLTLIVNELTFMRARRDGSAILRMDDPELMKFPIAYLSEPGYWYPSDTEAAALKTYLDKGGFLIVDDFHFAEEWAVFETAMKKVLPDARIDRLQLSHPIFSTFFSIKSLDVPYPGALGERGLMGEFYGIHDGNDPTKRLTGHHQLQHGHRRLHGAFRPGMVLGRADERGLQVRRELLHVRPDAVSPRAHLASPSSTKGAQNTGCSSSARPRGDTILPLRS